MCSKTGPPGPPPVSTVCKTENCEFHQPSVSFLGFVVAEEAKMDPEKVITVVSWTIATNLKEVQCFLGFANYYRKFITYLLLCML